MKTRIQLAEAQAKAAAIVRTLTPACDRIEVAGSIRRKCDTVGDVEIVCIPKMAATGLFGDGAPEDMLTKLCDGLLVSGKLAHRLDKNGRRSYGAKFKRLLFDGFPLDLFSTSADQWGVIMTIRTGPAEFSHRLVTKAEHGGMMPDGMRVADGWLCGLMTEHGDKIPCREESDLFDAIGYPWIAPEDRRCTCT